MPVKSLSPLLPGELIVERTRVETDRLIIKARPKARAAACSRCERPSRRVHSHYRRRLRDLPWQGRAVELHLRLRRFRCDAPDCPRRIFAERVEPVAPPRLRRTRRLAEIHRGLGLAVGGAPGARLAARLAVPVGADTLLRAARAMALPAVVAPRVVGIDDWAWRKGHRYGTLICDLERRTVIDLLPDREPTTVAAWLAARPSIEIIARDRGGGYATAASEARPEAVQVADRWHLMENASATFLMAVKRHMHEVRRALGQGPVDPATLTAAERLQYEGWVPRTEAEAVVLALHGEGLALKEIVRRTGRSRKLVREILRGGRTEPFRPRASSLEPWLDRLNSEWDAGCRNGAELWRRLRAAGFGGSLRVVAEWATRRRRDEAADTPRRCPSPRALARLLTLARDKLTRAEAMIVATVEREVPALVAARQVIEAFHRLVRARDENGLGAWLAEALASPVASFAKGIVADRAAVAAAIALPWSNGQTEGQICRLKRIRRQMSGRGGLDLLKARLTAAA